MMVKLEMCLLPQPLRTSQGREYEMRAFNSRNAYILVFKGHHTDPEYNCDECNIAILNVTCYRLNFRAGAINQSIANQNMILHCLWNFLNALRFSLESILRYVFATKWGFICFGNSQTHPNITHLMLKTSLEGYLWFKN